jgi:hypothetical protein
VRGRVAEDGMQRGDHGDVQRPHEVDDALAILAAPDPVFVLDRDDVDAVVQRAGGAEVVGRLVLPDPVMDLGGIERRLLGRVEDRDLATAGGCRQVVGEGRDATAARRVGRNEGGLDDQLGPLERACRRPGAVGAPRGR